MKKFLTHRSSSEIVKQCRKKKWKTDTSRHDQGGDHIVFEFKHRGTNLRVLFNTFNGRAFGSITKWGGITDREDVTFNTDATKDEREDWFQALLDFIYVPKPKGRWTPMNQPPKGARALHVMGSDGKSYRGSYVSGKFYNKLPRGVRAMGWRVTPPKDYEQ